MDKAEYTEHMRFVAGKRLKIAKEIKGLTWQELATGLEKLVPEDKARKFEVKVDNVKKWPTERGLPFKWIFFVLTYFKVDTWVFTNERLSDEEFKKIIHDPTWMDLLKPVDEVDATTPQSTDNIQINLSERNVAFQDDTTTTQQDIDTTISDFILTAIARMEEREAYFCNHFIETCRGKKELLQEEKRLEDLEKILEKQLHNDQRSNQKYEETKTALRAIKYVIEQSSNPKYHEFKGDFFFKKLLDLTLEIKNIEDMPPLKFKRLQWLLDSACIEYDELDEDKRRPNYAGQLRAIHLVIEFGYMISLKETLYEFFNDSAYHYYLELQNRAMDILKRYHESADLGYIRWEKVILWFNKGKKFRIRPGRYLSYFYQQLPTSPETWNMR